MPVADVYRVTISGVVGADLNENVLHYQVAASTATSAQEAQALAENWELEALPEYLALLNNHYTVRTIKVRGVTVPTAGYDLTVTGSGGVAGEISPAQTTALINTRTALFGRSFRGKIYLPALSESMVADGSISPTLITAIDTFMNEALTILEVGPPDVTYQMCVYSRLLGVPENVTGWQVSPFARTQRRRTPGVGA